MSQNSYSFPYPVLTVYGDDVQPSLPEDNVTAETPHTDDNNDYIMSITLKMDNETLLHNIQEGRAEFVLEVDCPATLFRRCERSVNNSFELKLPHNEIAGKVTIQPYIIAKIDFKYKSSNFHEDYEDAAFDVEAGDVLAIFSQVKYDFEIDYDELRAYSSIMTIRCADDEQTKTIRYISDEPKIIVILPKEEFDNYKSFKGDPAYISIIHASIVHNALLAVMLQEDWSDGDDSLLWKRTIRYRVEHEEALRPYRNLSEKENIIALSHKLLGNPIQRMFNSIVNNMSQD